MSKEIVKQFFILVHDFCRIAEAKKVADVDQAQNIYDFLLKNETYLRGILTPEIITLLSDNFNGKSCIAVKLNHVNNNTEFNKEYFQKLKEIESILLAKLEALS